MTQGEIAVVGAGVIGLTIALRLAQAGHEVVVIDPGDPGAGASYGNAGTIADYVFLVLAGAFTSLSIVKDTLFVR